MNPYRIILTKIYLFVKKNIFLIVLELLIISFFFAFGFIKGSQIILRPPLNICQDVLFSSSTEMINFKNDLPIYKNTEKRYVASKRGKYYYPIECFLVDNLNENNKIYFSTKEEAESRGFVKNNNCEY
ncbi:MAG: hypothetical protein ACPLW7_03240 [Minisyncoccia bacterium]